MTMKGALVCSNFVSEIRQSPWAVS